MSAEVFTFRPALKLWEALERGQTLPAAWYTSPALYRRAKHRIFRRSWQYVGRSQQRSTLSCAQE